MASRRLLMEIHYTSDNYANRLQEHLKECGISFVAFKEYEFTDGNAFWSIFIDRGHLSWSKIMQEVNYIRPVKFYWKNDGSYIKNGIMYTPC